MSLKYWVKEKFIQLIPYETPTSLTFGGWDKWEKETQANYPVAFFIFETAPSWISYRWQWWVTDPIYHIKCKYFKKYHHIRIDVERFIKPLNESENNLDCYHWYDSDTKILYGMFQILVDFIEKEKPGELIDWSSDPRHTKIWEEMQILYHWWVEDRPKNWSENEAPAMEDFGATHLDFDRNPKSPNYKAWSVACDECNKREAELENEDTEMLIRLITIRKYMWT